MSRQTLQNPSSYHGCNAYMLHTSTLMLLVANLANENAAKKLRKKTGTQSYGDFSKSYQRELSNEYQYDRV